MVTDAQVRRLKKLSKTETKELAAAKARMDVKTARKYLADGRLPSEAKPERNWRTREDPFERVWDEIREQIRTNPVWRPRRSSRRCSANALANLPTVSCVLCSGGSSDGARRKGQARRFSSPSSMCRDGWGSPTSPA